VTRQTGGRRPVTDAGRVSVFVAVAIAGLLAILGAAVDATGQLRTLLRADNLATEAARAAGQAIDVAAVAESGQPQVDPDQAARYARDYLATAGHDLPGSAWDVELNEDRTAVDITVRLTYRHRVLGLFGMPDPEVTGASTAVLVTGA
jgi:hypothetical protein